MLYVPEETRKQFAELVPQLQTGDPVEVSKRLLAIVPGYGPAYLLIGASLLADGKFDEAEALLWEGLEQAPCRATLYLNLAQVRTARSQGDVLAKRLRHLALWKLSFEDKIPEHLAKLFEPVVGDGAREPETYERLALFEDIEVEKA